MKKRTAATCLFAWPIFLSCLLLNRGAAKQTVVDASTVRQLAQQSATAETGQHVRTVERDGEKELELGGDALPLKTGDRFTSGAGGIDVRCRVPKKWPPENEQALFHIGDHPHEHVTLFVRGGWLNAVYKPDVDHYRSIRFPCNTWQPDSVHRIEFSWKTFSAGIVRLTLRVDDQLVGTQEAPQLKHWPERFFIGGRGRKGTTWDGRLARVIISSEPLPIPELESGKWNIDIDTTKDVGPAYNFWSIKNFTSEDIFADNRQRPRIARLHPYMKYVNTVRLIGGRSDGKNVFFRGIDGQGDPICDFRLLKQYLGGICGWGYTPRIVLDNVPNALNPSGEFNTYGNTAPPKDNKLFAKYIEQLVRAMVKQFGIETVRGWRFRVGTEPDLYPGHWSGTREEYFKHYDYTVDAVCRVIPDADIGPGNILNPADSQKLSHGRKRWGLDIIDHAATGKNYVTGKTGTRLRHFSCSWYGRVGKSIDSFDVAIGRMRSRLDRFPQFHAVPVEVAEFAVLTDEQGRRTSGGDPTEWGASWYAAIADRVYRLNVAQVHNWAITWNGMRYARTNVMAMLEKMQGGQRLDCSVAGTSKAKCGALACRKGSSVFVMLYNHRPMRRPAVMEDVQLTIRDPHMKLGTVWKMSQWDVDQQHGTFIHTFHADCKAAGLEPDLDSSEFGGPASIFSRFGPESRKLLIKNRAKYDTLSQLPQTKKAISLPVAAACVQLKITMPGHSVRLLEIHP